MTGSRGSPKEPGRNDPCPCGSGKLYKHCCRSSRRERRRSRRQRFVEATSQTAPTQPDQIRHMAQDVKPHLSTEQAQQLEHFLEVTEDVSAYEAVKYEVEAAAKTLEDHRPEFEGLLDHPQGMVDRAHRLFSEETFHSMRNTIADVHRAFEAVGYPRQSFEGSQQISDAIVDAILYLADEKRRLHLARHLMMSLPQYVSAGRYLDAWLIQYCAVQMLEAPDRSNPFLSEIFLNAFAKWAEQVKAEQVALLGELGVAPSEIAGMTFEEMESWVQEAMADPDRSAWLETYYASHRLLSDQAEAHSQEMDQATLQLLDREDADRLLLSPEELDPWIPALVERLEPIGAQFRQVLERDKDSTPRLQDAVSKELVALSNEMAVEIFTPERLDRLVSELQAYRDDLQNARERQTAVRAHAAAMRLVSTGDRSGHPLLFGICFASLRAMLVAQADVAQTIANLPE